MIGLTSLFNQFVTQIDNLAPVICFTLQTDGHVSCFVKNKYLDAAHKAGLVSLVYSNNVTSRQSLNHNSQSNPKQLTLQLIV